MVIFKGPPSKGKLPRSPSRMWILRMTILCAESMAFGKPFIVGHEKVILDLWLLPFGLENGGKPLVPLKTMTIGPRALNALTQDVAIIWKKAWKLGMLGKDDLICNQFCLHLEIRLLDFRIWKSQVAVSQWSWIPLMRPKQAALQPCCSFHSLARPRPSCVCQHWMAVVGYSPNGSLMTFRTWR